MDGAQFFARYLANLPSLSPSIPQLLVDDDGALQVLEGALRSALDTRLVIRQQVGEFRLERRQDDQSGSDVDLSHVLGRR
jgi:hypothetical protein